jgi:hypothetical protein
LGRIFTVPDRRASIQSYRSIAAIGGADSRPLAGSFVMRSARGRQSEVDRLVAELEKAEAYEQRLRQFIVDIRAELAAGHVATAMSMLNEALNFIDNATDVVAPHRDDAPPHR